MFVGDWRIQYSLGLIKELEIIRRCYYFVNIIYEYFDAYLLIPKLIYKFISILVTVGI